MSSAHIPIFLRKLVIRRAGDRCEYCRLSQIGQEATFHIDHVIPIASGGKTIAENLAFACVSCSLRKGAKEFAFDPKTNKNERIFNPRRTSIGRAAVELLNLNRKLIVAIRREELLLGRLFE